MRQIWIEIIFARKIVHHNIFTGPPAYRLETCTSRAEAGRGSQTNEVERAGPGFLVQRANLVDLNTFFYIIGKIYELFVHSTNTWKYIGFNAWLQCK
jgi:hypothetical protein